MSVVDAPRLAYRALMVDVARSFLDKRFILRLLDVMAMYKMNVLHLHLSDDQGWRLEVPSLPELTNVNMLHQFCTVPICLSNCEVYCFNPHAMIASVFHMICPSCFSYSASES